MISNIILSCLYAIIFSFFANIIIDFVLTILTVVFKTKFISDILFIISFTITDILILYFLNNGSFRWYYMISQILGALIYYCSIGKILRAIIYHLRKLFNKIKLCYHKFNLSFSIAKLPRKMYNKFKV